ncbi:hypothetical protein KAR34_07885 [bacterium]|nr:hypothetical protein [bacterium]
MAIDLEPYECVKTAKYFSRLLKKPLVFIRSKPDGFEVKNLFRVLRGDEVEQNLGTGRGGIQKTKEDHIKEKIKKYVKKILRQRIRDKTIECFPREAVLLVAKTVGLEFAAPQANYDSPTNIVRNTLSSRYRTQIHSAYNVYEKRKSREYIVVAGIKDIKAPYRKVSTQELNILLAGKNGFKRAVYYPEMRLSNFFKIKFENPVKK